MKYLILLLIVVLSSCDVTKENDTVGSHFSSNEILTIGEITSDSTIQTKEVYLVKVEKIGFFGDESMLIVDAEDTNKIHYRHKTRIGKTILSLILMGLFGYIIGKI